MSGLTGRPLRAIALSDGVAGHDRITLGVLTAVARRRAVHTRSLGVRERGAGSRRLDRLHARLAPFERFWSARYEAAHADAPSPVALAREPFDIVVSAGPSTGAANIALARATGARSIYFGFPKLPLIREFDLLLRPDQPRLGFGPGEVVLRPSEIDPDLLPPPRRGAERKRVALMLGGVTKFHTFTDQDFQGFAAIVRTLTAAGLEVVVSNSRRTPPDAFDAFVSELAPRGAKVTIIDFRRGGLMSNADVFATDAIIVTADSMSMIAEAIAARRPTVVARPDGYRPPARDAREIATHVRSNLALESSVSALALLDWINRLDGLRTLETNPLDRLADVLSAVLPPKMGV
ncbi:ELM1/GtrOC1 family putative glycosyltransferase [Methylopila sp. Yamaguchi]|uniref:ELM1/GtrOC1 family putative glycosyltransferase n=1 Tax=Methylopila sp. Yamaguchi TaxID=1437817 RepID=UPI000CC58D6F|nr:ELM1/GtrOC1 family putative glycosyltransferase [Methylopila sp. Yamaguchi]GBD50018.1 hypothetical protein METY_3231 [Methylopila sp. Yamaguchi]